MLQLCLSKISLLPPPRPAPPPPPNNPHSTPHHSSTWAGEGERLDPSPICKTQVWYTLILCRSYAIFLWFQEPFLHYMTCGSGPWGSQSPYAGTPASYAHTSPQRVATPATYAAMPGSNQPYTCFVCNATATSKKNYIAHLQVSLHTVPAGLLPTCTAVGLHPHVGMTWYSVVWCELFQQVMPRFFRIASVNTT